jgi:regulator of sigma E protease
MDYPTTFLGWAGLIGLGGLGFLFTITLVVFVHELGHFLAARFFGVKVESFSIGFGRAMAGFRDRYGTHWKIGWLPLGGYVKFWGDDSVSSTPDHEKLDRASAAELAGSFHHKKLYQKAVIAVAGPVANFIFAIVILTGLFLIFGDYVTSAQIGRVLPGGPAERAGLQVGDTVLSIDGNPVREFQDIVANVSVGQGRVLQFRVQRGTEVVELPVTPGTIEKADPFSSRKVKDTGIGIGPVSPGEVKSVVTDSPAGRAGLKAGDFIFKANGAPVDSFAVIATAMADSNGKPVTLTVSRDPLDPAKSKKRQEVDLHVTPNLVANPQDTADEIVAQAAGFAAVVPGAPKVVVPVRFGPIEAFTRAVGTVRYIVVKTLDFIGMLLTGRGDYQQLSGPIGIASVSGQVLVFFGLVPLINLAAVLSVSIGLLNLFPIPMLDGGHLLYYGIEAVRGRPLGERAQELGFRIGFVFVVGLMLFATWNDLTKFF